MQQSMDSQQDSPPSAHGTQGPVAYNRFIYIYYFTYLRYFFNKYPHTLYTVKSTPTAYTNRVCKPNLCMNTNTHFTPIPTYFHKHYPKPSSPLRYPKIHLPSFDGSDPLGWLFQDDQYFLYYQIPLEQSLITLGSFLYGGWGIQLVQEDVLKLSTQWLDILYSCPRTKVWPFYSCESPS